MKLLDWFSAIGQSSTQIVFAQRVYSIMLQHHLGLIQSEAKKMLKAKAELEATGKTKLDWDEGVKAKNFVWSTDVMAAENHLGREDVVEAFKYLEANRKVKRFFLSGRASQCVYIPVEKVLGHGKL